MSREFRIINNKIEINDSSVEFMYLIKSAKAVDDRIIVLLEIPYDIDEADNLYCLSKNGTIIWQSQHLHELYPTERILLYEQIIINDREIIASDFYGRRYFVNFENGFIIKREISKWEYFHDNYKMGNRYNHWYWTQNQNDFILNKIIGYL